jgi:D-galactarolactone cycloisomerase
MKIDHIRCRIVSHPLPAPLRPAWAPGRTFEHTACTLVEITTDEGLSGLGALPHADPIGLYTVAELVAPYILGKDPFAIERVSPILRHAARDGAYPWGVEMALWDIIGQACNQPVYRLWGGYQDSLPAYASLAEIPEPAEQIERLHLLRDKGFRAAKLRLRRPNIDDDIDLVRQVRAEFGEGLDLMADANQAHVMPSPGPHNFWSFADALKVARALEELDVLWLEEPLPRYNYDQLSALTARVDLPIAGGELNIGCTSTASSSSATVTTSSKPTPPFPRGYPNCARWPPWPSWPSSPSSPTPGPTASGWGPTSTWRRRYPTAPGSSSRWTHPPGPRHRAILC